MFFFIRKNKLVLDCLTNNASAAELFPLQSAQQAIPKWLQKLPTVADRKDDFVPKKNMRECVGLTSLYRVGFVVPLWADLNVKTAPDSTGRVSLGTVFGDHSSQVAYHPSEQYAGFCDDQNYLHVKLMAPWHIQEKTGVKWVFMEPTWNKKRLSNYVTPPGIIDFKHQHAVHINMLFSFDVGETLTHFDAGHPLAHCIPMSDKKVELRIHRVTDAEFHYKSASTPLFTFFSNYTMRKDLRKKNKCPFGGNV